MDNPALSRRMALTGMGAAAFTALVPHSALALELEALGAPLAFQALPIRRFLVQDFGGTLRVMRTMGYGRIELASFPGMVGNFRGDFSPLERTPAGEIRRHLLAAQLPCDSCAFLAHEFEPEYWPHTLAWARAIGVKTMIIMGGDPSAQASATELGRYFDSLNAAGERVREAGMTLWAHTYAAIWKPAAGGGALVDQLLAKVDAAHCQLQIDFGSVGQVEGDGAELIRRYGARIASVHLRDGKKPTDPNAYFPALALGEGEVQWAPVIRAARQAGVRDYVVEMQVRPLIGVLDAHKTSIDYLRAMT